MVLIVCNRNDDLLYIERKMPKFMAVNELKRMMKPYGGSFEYSPIFFYKRKNVYQKKHLPHYP
jgi:hypothetical protein